MAVGDVVSDLAAGIANNDSMTIQPGSGSEWNIHNIYFSADVEVYYYDDINYSLVTAETGAGALTKQSLHVTHTCYLKVKNVSGAASNLGYDGIETKAA